MRSTNTLLFITKIFLAGFLLLALPLSVSASGMHLKVGDIKGESQDDKHKGEIQIVAWEFAASNPGSFQGGHFNSSRADYSDIVITKYVDSASAKLAAAVANGQPIKEATLTVAKAGARQAQDYLKIKLTDVVVTSISMSGSDGDDRLAEEVSLSYAKMEMEYTAFDQNSSAEKGKSTLVIDRAANTASAK